MKAAIGAAFGVAGAPRTLGTRIDVGEGKHSQRRDEKDYSSHESLLNIDSNNSALPYHWTCPIHVMQVTLLAAVAANRHRNRKPKERDFCYNSQHRGQSAAFPADDGHRPREGGSLAAWECWGS
jgi:hypothetical protein